MTEREIDKAIRAYRRGRENQSKTRVSAVAERKRKLLEEELPGEKGGGEGREVQKIDRDSLYAFDRSKLEERQRRRSAVARKAYETRLRNEADRAAAASSASRSKNTRSKDGVVTVQKTTKRLFLQSSARPQDVMIRIQSVLDRGSLPSADDVRLISEPLRMPKRREVLRRILSDYFDLRGRCVPSSSDPDDSGNAMLYATQAPMSDLSLFVIRLLEEGTPPGDTGPER